MARYILTCMDCGVEQEVGRSDARVCRKCRALRNLNFAAGITRRRTCRACKAVYVPIQANEKSRLCGGCLEAGGIEGDRITCVICKQDRTSALELPVCWPCLKGKDLQRKVLAALRKGQGERQDRYAQELAALAGGAAHLRVVDPSVRDKQLAACQP